MLFQHTSESSYERGWILTSLIVSLMDCQPGRINPDQDRQIFHWHPLMNLAIRIRRRSGCPPLYADDKELKLLMMHHTLDCLGGWLKGLLFFFSNPYEYGRREFIMSCCCWSTVYNALVGGFCAQDGSPIDCC